MPSVYSCMMAHVLRDLDFVSVFLDDCLIASENVAQHLEHLEIVFQRLTAAGIQLKAKKVKMFQPSVEYLGFVISETGIQPSPRLLVKLEDMKAPTSPKEVKMFLGLVNFMRTFIPDCAVLQEPLTLLLRKKAPWVWSEACQESFDTMKELLGSSPVLRYPDYSKPFELYPDASRYQLGALLAQRETPTSEPHAIAYWSRMMIPAERNYTTSEQECLAIVEPLKRWQMYLLNYPFTVHVKTDHHPLTSLMTAHHESARLTRWALTMQEYQPQLTIKHIAGREQPGDPLSRLDPRVLDDCKCNLGHSCSHLGSCWSLRYLGRTTLTKMIYNPHR